eukprot:910743-Prymnesium_polylepis.2
MRRRGEHGEQWSTKGSGPCPGACGCAPPGCVRVCELMTRCRATRGRARAYGAPVSGIGLSWHVERRGESK